MMQELQIRIDPKSLSFLPLLAGWFKLSLPSDPVFVNIDVEHVKHQNLLNDSAKNISQTLGFIGLFIGFHTFFMAFPMFPMDNPEAPFAKTPPTRSLKVSTRPSSTKHQPCRWSSRELRSKCRTFRTILEACEKKTE